MGPNQAPEPQKPSSLDQLAANVESGAAAGDLEATRSAFDAFCEAAQGRITELASRTACTIQAKSGWKEALRYLNALESHENLTADQRDEAVEDLVDQLLTANDIDSANELFEACLDTHNQRPYASSAAYMILAIAKAHLNSGDTKAFLALAEQHKYSIDHDEVCGSLAADLLDAAFGVEDPDLWKSAITDRDNTIFRMAIDRSKVETCVPLLLAKLQEGEKFTEMAEVLSSVHYLLAEDTTGYWVGILAGQKYLTEDTDAGTALESAEWGETNETESNRAAEVAVEWLSNNGDEEKAKKFTLDVAQESNITPITLAKCVNKYNETFSEKAADLVEEVGTCLVNLRQLERAIQFLELVRSGLGRGWPKVCMRIADQTSGADLGKFIRGLPEFSAILTTDQLSQYGARSLAT